ncbi:MAG TPA: hypothetical protein VN649_04130 [Ramlibacter sp.]|nr:hypothetical protein [Ramlibacter sp.]
MIIDLLPFAAFALESSGHSVPPGVERHTLTLGLNGPALDSSYDSQPMSGNARIEDVAPPSEAILRAAVLPADGPGLTITF